MSKVNPDSTIRNSQKKARDKWDKENMGTITCKLRKEHAERFKAYAKQNGTTANALLRGYVLETIGENDSEEKPLE